jgi:phosphohistidine phosphatase
MRLLVIRHAIAMDREEFASSGQSDNMRPLTDKGMKRMKKVARGLREEIGRIDHLATSPLTRAVQTAEIVSDVFAMKEAEVTAALAPDVAFEDFELWCNTHANTDVLGVVGHEPHLSSLATWLMTGNKDSRISLRKGGACLIEFESEPRRASGTLLWLLTPRQLRGLAQ